MSHFMKMLFARRYREAAGENGDEGGGTPAVDLGDELPSDKPAPVVDKELTDEEKAALPGKKDEDDEGEQARDKDGKFVKKEKTDTPMIPKARVDELVAKERERAEILERRLIELAQQNKRGETQETIADLEKQAKELRAAERKALIDGNEEKAEEYSSQRDALNRKIARIENQSDTSEVSAQTIEKIRMDTTIESLKETFPQLDESHADFDEALVDDVLDKQAGYIKREAMSPAAALAKAAKYIMSRQKADPEPAAAGLAKGQNVDRKAAAVSKNVAAAAAQPASLKLAGMDSDKSGAKGLPDISKMSTDEYEALPEATKARLRGDIL